MRDPHPFFEDVRKAAREETVELQRQLRGLAEGGQRSRAAGWARQAGLPALRRSGSSLSTEAARADFSKYLRTLEEALDACDTTQRNAQDDARVQSAAAQGAAQLAEEVAAQSGRDGILDGIVPAPNAGKGDGPERYFAAAEQYMSATLDAAEVSEDGAAQLSVDGFLSSLLRMGDDDESKGMWRNVAPVFLGGAEAASPVTAVAACEAWKTAMAANLADEARRARLVDVLIEGQLVQRSGGRGDFQDGVQPEPEGEEGREELSRAEVREILERIHGVASVAAAAPGSGHAMLGAQALAKVRVEQQVQALCEDAESVPVEAVRRQLGGAKGADPVDVDPADVGLGLRLRT